MVYYLQAQFPWSNAQGHTVFVGPTLHWIVHLSPFFKVKGISSILIMHIIVFYFRAEGYVKLNVNINVQVIFSQDIFYRLASFDRFFSTVFNCISCYILQLGPSTSQCDFISYFEFYLTTDLHTFKPDTRGVRLWKKKLLWNAAYFNWACIYSVFSFVTVMCSISSQYLGQLNIIKSIQCFNRLTVLLFTQKCCEDCEAWLLEKQKINISFIKISCHCYLR